MDPYDSEPFKRARVAVALRYRPEEGDDAPAIVASGEGDLAEQIRRAAYDYGVPIVHDVPLAHALRELSAGDAIPEELYDAMAAVLLELQEEDTP